MRLSRIKDEALVELILRNEMTKDLIQVVQASRRGIRLDAIENKGIL